MEPQHQTTSGSSEPHAPPHKPAQAQRASGNDDNQQQQQQQQEKEKGETTAASTNDDKQDLLGELRGSHDDLGDLTDENLVEYTAFVVAYARAAESKRDDAIMNDPYAELLAGEAGGALLSFFSKWSPRANDLGDFVALRTRSIDEALIHRDANIRQVVILGAGLDTRAYRMKSLSDCHVIEIDASQSMMDRKYKLLHDAGAHVLAQQHHVVIADLAQDAWQTDLITAGFNPKQPTFWILEGLLYYMTRDSNVRLIKTIDALSSKGSQLWADLSGLALVKASGGECEDMFRTHALKYGENDPTQGVLSLLKWRMDVVRSSSSSSSSESTSVTQPLELFGREFKSMTVVDSGTGREEDAPWFFVTATKHQDPPSEEPLL